MSIVSEELGRYLLSLPKKKKLGMLKEAYEAGQTNVFTALLDLYLETPIVGGGISSDDIQTFLK